VARGLERGQRARLRLAATLLLRSRDLLIRSWDADAYMPGEQADHWLHGCGTEQ